MNSGYGLVLATVLLTVYGQVIIKWQVLKMGSLPAAPYEKFVFLFHLLINPWIISALFAAFLASVTWMAAMTKLPLSQGYPLTSLSFILILILGSYFFGEAISFSKLLGMAFILVGIVFISKG